MLLKPAKTLFDFSFIVTTRNNSKELVRTINSIISEAPSKSEIVVVDGSDEPPGKEWVINNFLLKDIQLTYTLDNKVGVYDAMNVGIENSLGEWIIIMTAGDYLETNAKALLESIRHLEKEVVVFAQHVENQSGNLSFTFTPTHNSIWPHQSVIVKRKVHEIEGLYSLDYRYGSEQYLFASIRKAFPFDLRKEVFSVFCLGGITSGSSLAMSKDVFAIRRKLGHGLISSFIHSYIFPPIRFGLEKYTFLRPLSMRIKRAIFSNYNKPKQTN